MKKSPLLQDPPKSKTPVADVIMNTAVGFDFEGARNKKGNDLITPLPDKLAGKLKAGGIAGKAFAKVPKQEAFMKTVSPMKQTGMVDPMLTNAQGMPVDPMQAAQPMQPINVGMPGSMPVPAGVGHNMQQPVPAGQRMLNPIAPMAMKGDLDKDGKMSSYEQARQTAIEKNMKK